MTSPTLPRYIRKHTGPTPQHMTRRKRKVMHRMARAFVAKYDISPVLVRAMKRQLDVEQSTLAQQRRARAR